MSSCAPAPTAARKGAMSADVRVVTRSVTPAVVSVLPATRPSPGKCLAVRARPVDRIPRTKAVPFSATTAGVWPNSRWKRPIGAFVDANDADTVSMTGARLTLTPARRTWLPQAVALRVRPASVNVPWVRAVGILANHGPCRTWT